MTCPKCRRRQYTVCSNRNCVCWKRVPKGKLPQRVTGHDGIACAYCGFETHIDYWFDREIEQFTRSMGAKSLTEAAEIHAARLSA